MCNRYYVRLHHPVKYGVDIELLADDPAEAATLALDACPADTFLERVVPLEIDVREPDGTPTPKRLLSRERIT